MLTRRVVTRPATLRSQLQRRFIPSSASITTSESQLQAPRPNTWLAKIRFREDGKPRSKLIALGFGSLILSSVFSSLTLIGTKEDEKNIQKYLLTMTFFQHVDMTAYDSVNFDDPKSTLSYFRSLYLAYMTSEDPEVNQIFNDIMTRITAITNETKNPEIEAKAQYIMRSAAKKIHGAFQELKRDSIVTNSEFVFNVLQDALMGLLYLSFGGIVDDDDYYFTEFSSFVRDHTNKDETLGKG